MFDIFIFQNIYLDLKLYEIYFFSNKLNRNKQVFILAIVGKYFLFCKRIVKHGI